MTRAFAVPGVPPPAAGRVDPPASPPSVGRPKIMRLPREFMLPPLGLMLPPGIPGIIIPLFGVEEPPIAKGGRLPSGPSGVLGPVGVLGPPVPGVSDAVERVTSRTWWNDTCVICMRSRELLNDERTSWMCADNLARYDRVGAEARPRGRARARRRAFPKWADTPPIRRARIMFKYLELVNAQRPVNHVPSPIFERRLLMHQRS